MTNNLPIVTVDLGDGDYVKLYRYLRVKTQRAVREYCLPLAPEGEQLDSKHIVGHESELAGIFFVNQAVELRLTVVTRQPRKWPFRAKVKVEHRTFGPPFDWPTITGTLDEVGLDKLNIIEREMNRLYTPDPFPTSAS